MRYLPASLLGLLTAVGIAHAAKLTPRTTAAFDRYIELTEARMTGNLAPDHFLSIDGHPDQQAKVRDGQTLVEPAAALDHGKPVKIPDGMVQDWVGTMFIPGASIKQVKAVLQDYGNYKSFYQPDVIESRETSHQGDEYDVFLRLYKKQILTVVLNSNYRVRYGILDTARMYVISRSTRIAEARDAKHPDAGEYPPGDDTGFLWRLNSYWRFEETGGGVYAECEAISLSRDVPSWIGWMVRRFVEKFPKESMFATLLGTKAAVKNLCCARPGGKSAMPPAPTSERAPVGNTFVQRDTARPNLRTPANPPSPNARNTVKDGSGVPVVGITRSPVTVKSRWPVSVEAPKVVEIAGEPTAPVAVRSPFCVTSGPSV